MLCGEPGEHLGEGLIESLFCPCLGSARELFELLPGSPDGVQAGRVRRWGEQPGSCRLNSFSHSAYLVRSEIVGPKLTPK